MAMLRLAACISPRNQFQSFDVPKLVFLARVYYEPIFPDLELALLEQQLLCFKHAIEFDNALRGIKTLPSLCKLMVTSGRAESGYNLVFRLISLILTLSVSTAMGERVFSALRLVKPACEH